jgi:hypothetical protein
MHNFIFGPECDQGLPGLLLRRRRDRQAAAATRAQRHARGRVAGAVREARRVPGADGLDVPLVLLVRQRLQLRLPRHPRRPGRAGAGPLPHRSRTRPRPEHRGREDRGRRACVAKNCRASARSCGSARRSSTPTPRTAAASNSSTTATSTSTSPPSAARRRGRNRRDALSHSACMSSAPRRSARRIRHLTCGPPIGLTQSVGTLVSVDRLSYPGREAIGGSLQGRVPSGGHHCGFSDQ